MVLKDIPSTCLSGKCMVIVEGVACAPAKTTLPEHWTKDALENRYVGDRMLFRDVWERRSQEGDC